jgi:hypothetical protein
VLCLYCDTELKPFRGLFDEDFCSREHREKYLSSFRKALTGFGGQPEPVEKTIEPPLSVPAAPAPDPRTAGFQPIRVFPLNHEAGRDGHPPESLTVSQEVEIPNSEIAWSAVLEFEERPADLATPSEGTFETVEPTPSVHGLSPNLPSLPTSAGTPVLAPASAGEYAPLTLFCEQLRSAPVPSSEMATVLETQIPAFSPASEVLQGDDQQHTPNETEPYWGELYSEPAPAGVELGSSLAVAPEMAWSSVPVDRPVSGQGNLPVMMLPSLELAPAHSGDGLSSAVDLRPQLAPERPTDFVDGDAVDSSAAPRSHEPLKLTFANLVKIKNWRLRITFAKPA